jgi:Transglycosylase SLT domain
MAIPYLACMALVAAWNRLPPRVLPSIQAVEGGQVGMVHPDADGSEDLGLMQINTRWIVPLARYTGQSERTIRERLIGNACFNIAAAGAIMAAYLAQEHGDLMRAVGDYHSHTPALNEQYQQSVMGAARALFQQGR